MRNHSSAMTILNDEALLYSLNHHQMKQMIKLINKQKEQRCGGKIFDNKFTHAAFNALKARLSYHNPKYSYPVFIKPGDLKQGLLPICQLMSHKRAKSSLLHNDIFVAHSSKPLFQKKPIHFPTKKDLDAITKALSSHHDFPWEYIRNGCQNRSNLTISYLKALNINLKCISQIFSVAPDLKIYDQQGDCHEWGYHVAPYITTDDGNEWVIDPSLCPNKALPLRKWIGLQKEIPTTVYTLRKINRMRKYSFPRSHTVFLNVPCNFRLTSINYIYEQNLVFVEFKDERNKDLVDDFKILSGYRFKLERKMLLGTYYKILLDKYLLV